MATTSKTATPGKQKRLLIVNSRWLPLIGGGETYIMELMQHFSSNGWDVHLATRDCGVTDPTWGNCSIHYMDGFDDEDQHPRESLHDLRLLLDELKPDLVHVHNIWPFFTFSNITYPGEYPTVLTIHNVPVVPERLFGNGSLGDFGVECAFLGQLLAADKHDKLLVGSQYYLDSFAGALPQLKTDGKSSVAYYFLPTMTKGPFKAKTKSLKDGEVKLLFPSRVMVRKGIEDMLQALALLPDRFTMLIPAFANGGFVDYQEKIKKLIDELGLTDRVTIPDGVTPTEDMPKYYQEADMVVIPSHFEGFGIVALEAMSWGAPVVAAGVGGLREIVQHEKNGLLIAPQDPEGIAAAIERIADSDDLRIKFIENGLKTSKKEEFSRKGQMERMEVSYEDALQAHKARLQKK